ncbi:MAG: hypothetical protein J6331_03035 [Lentisphaeria bacterium]|nr:hypothetical protein [Lentisphaeria bacterium]
MKTTLFSVLCLIVAALFSGCSDGGKTEKLKGQEAGSLIGFAQKVLESAKRSPGDFRKMAHNPKDASIKECYESLRTVELAEKPQWTAEKAAEEGQYYAKFTTAKGGRVFILAAKNAKGEWKFLYAGQ